LLDFKNLSQAIGTGAAGGAFAAVLGHYFAGGKITFPIFLIIFVLSLSTIKGWARLVGLLAFVVSAVVVLGIFCKLKAM
jgi:hypothetical protein